MQNMDQQNVLVIGGAVVGLFVVGGMFLSAPEAQRAGSRPTYAEDDIRYKFQQEDLKRKKAGKKSVARDDGDDHSPAPSGGDNEEPSVFDHEPQEEPPLD
jgi:hypothetical protein